MVFLVSPRRRILPALLAAAACASPPPALAAGTPLERAVVRAVNAQRSAHGLAPVRTSRPLLRAARRHSRDQERRGRIGHGPAFARRLRAATRARRVGECVGRLPAGTRRRATVMVQAWMSSPSHRRQLLGRTYRRIGVGARSGAAGTVMTADFATRR